MMRAPQARIDALRELAAECVHASRWSMAGTTEGWIHQAAKTLTRASSMFQALADDATPCDDEPDEWADAGRWRFRAVSPGRVMLIVDRVEPEIAGMYADRLRAAAERAGVASVVFAPGDVTLEDAGKLSDAADTAAAAKVAGEMFLVELRELAGRPATAEDLERIAADNNGITGKRYDA